MHDSAVESHASQDEPWRIPAPAHGAVAILILGVTGASLHFFYTRGLSNLYGDGLAHMEGARRIFDSITPGYEEIGSVWLPLYHLICAPLAINDFLWRTGLAGGLVSSAAFALTCYLLFRLGAEINRNLAAGLVALAGALMCPSFLYLASTPLTEPLALLWSVLVVYALFRYAQSGSWKSLAGAAAAAFAGNAHALRRVERSAFCHPAGIPDPPVPVEAALPSRVLLRRRRRHRSPVVAYSQCLSLQEPFGILQWPRLGEGYLRPPIGNDGVSVIPLMAVCSLSARYYLEDLKLVIGVWALELAVLGLVAWCASMRESRRGAVAVLFIVPLPFYIQAMAHAAVPLYVPTLFPHTYYNLRYGVEMIPAVALFPSFVFSPRLGKKLRITLLIVFLAVLGRQFAVLTAEGPGNCPS